MDHSEYWGQLMRRKLSRRAALRGGVLAGAGLVASSITGCGGSTETSKVSNGSGATPEARLSGAETPKYGGVLTLAIESDAPSFDLHQETSYTVYDPTLPCYSGLLQFDPLDENKIIGDLATKWEVSADGLAYTFQLAEGAKFHNGDPVTSEDVRFSFDRIRKPPEGMVSPRKGSFASIVAIDTPGPTSVVFRLKQKSASFLLNIASPFQVIMPKKVVEEKGDMKKTILGSGPFKLKAYTRGGSLELEKNPDYFVKGRPYLDGLKWYIIPDATAKNAALRTGRILHSNSQHSISDPATLEALKKEMGDKLVVQTSPLICPTDLIVRFRGPLEDLKVRRALSLALDRRGSMSQALPDSAVGGYMPPGSQWALPESELAKTPGFGGDAKANKDEAKRLLAEAGYPNGFELKITTRALNTFTDPALWIIDQLKDVGIEAKMDVLETTAYFDAQTKKQFDTLLSNPCMDLDDPDSVFGQLFFTGAGRNYNDFSDSRLDQLYLQQTAETDLQKRKQLVNQMERIVFESLPMIRMRWRTSVIAHWSSVRNWKLGAAGMFGRKFQDVWLAQ